jgi:hypothetical protein
VCGSGVWWGGGRGWGFPCCGFGGVRVACGGTAVLLRGWPWGWLACGRTWLLLLGVGAEGAGAGELWLPVFSLTGVYGRWGC